MIQRSGVEGIDLAFGVHILIGRPRFSADKPKM
jgi:hypothetical protein